MIKTSDYEIAVADNRQINISGVLRLASPMAYEAPFQVIYDQLKQFSALTINLHELTFLNSAGLNAFAQIIILCRDNQIPLTLICNKDIPWQVKSIAGSLVQLSSLLTVELA